MHTQVHIKPWDFKAKGIDIYVSMLVVILYYNFLWCNLEKMCKIIKHLYYYFLQMTTAIICITKKKIKIQSYYMDTCNTQKMITQITPTWV